MQDESTEATRQAQRTETLDQICDYAMNLSAQTQGRPADWSGQYGSLVFAKLCITCISFLQMIPNSAFYTPATSFCLWDLSSAASLCRSLMEAYYILVYVVSGSPDDNDSEFRRVLWEYHCAFERHEILRVSLPNSAALSGVSMSLAKRQIALQNSPRFQKLSPGQQKELLKGKQFKLLSNTELSRASGISENYYRAQYKYCSNFAHSSPYSISQLDSFRAATPEAEQILGTLVDLATGYTALAIRDFSRIFPDQEAILPAFVKECISLWEEIFKWEKQPWFNDQDSTSI